MIKKPAQHTAITFLTQRGIGVATLLVVVLLFPLLLLLTIGVKVGVVLGIHFLIESLTGSWFVLYLFGALTALFTFFGFISRTVELGNYFTGLKLYCRGQATKCWYWVIFTVDFLVTDMLTLCASALLAYVYWMAAATQDYLIFYEFLQPFLFLSILGGLLQILFSSYYLTHERLQKIYLYATNTEHIFGQSPLYKGRSTVAGSSVVRSSTTSKKKTAIKRKAPKRKVAKRKTAKKSSRKPARKKAKRKTRRR